MTDLTITAGMGPVDQAALTRLCSDVDCSRQRKTGDACIHAALRWRRQHTALGSHAVAAGPCRHVVLGKHDDVMLSVTCPGARVAQPVSHACPAGVVVDWIAHAVLERGHEAAGRKIGRGDDVTDQLQRALGHQHVVKHGMGGVLVEVRVNVYSLTHGLH